MPDNQLTEIQFAKPDQKPDFSIEEWKDVSGWEGFYQVSNLGRVKSFAGRGQQKTTKRNNPYYTYCPIREKIISQAYYTANPKKYAYITLCMPGRRLKISVAHLVLETFVCPRPGGMEACHNDGNRNNNKLSNLRWDTHKNNMADRVKHGTVNSGARHGLSVFKNPSVDIPEIHRLYIEGATVKEIGKLYGVCSQAVHNALRGKTYKASQPPQNLRAILRKSGPRSPGLQKL